MCDRIWSIVTDKEPVFTVYNTFLQNPFLIIHSLFFCKICSVFLQKTALITLKIYLNERDLLEITVFKMMMQCHDKADVI